MTAPLRWTAPWPRLRVGIAALLSLTVGCTSVDRAARAARDQIDGAPARARERADRGAHATGATAATFREWAAQACRQNLRITAGLNRLRQAGVRIDQAESLPWPRLDLGVTAVLPVGGGDDSDPYLNGGLQLRYDVLQALFFRDRVSAEQVQLQRESWSCCETACDLIYDLLALSLAHQQALQEVGFRQRLVDSAEKCCQVMATLSKEGRAGVGVLLDCRRALRGRRADLARARRDSEVAYEELLRALGWDQDGDLAITGVGELVASLEAAHASVQEPQVLLKTAWAQRYDVKVAEAEVFLAELRVSEAARARLPNVTVSLGFGNIVSISNGDASPAAAEVGIALPLIDWGDSKRLRRLASLERDLAREKAVLLAQGLGAEVRTARRQLERATRYRDEAMADAARLKAELAAIGDLRQEGSLQLLNAAETEAATIEADMAIASAENERVSCVVRLARICNILPDGLGPADLLDLKALGPEVSPVRGPDGTP